MSISPIEQKGRNGFVVLESTDENEYDNSPACDSTRLPQCFFVHERNCAVISSESSARHCRSVKCAGGSGARVPGCQQSRSRHTPEGNHCSLRLASGAEAGGRSGMGIFGGYCARELMIQEEDSNETPKQSFDAPNNLELEADASLQEEVYRRK